jgi:hypothetical protein
VSDGTSWSVVFRKVFYTGGMSTTSNNATLLRVLNAQIKKLQKELAEASAREGKDEYVKVKLGKNQGRFKRTKDAAGENIAEGHFYIEILITALLDPIFVPLSVATGKKVAGFMYHIEGTGEAAIRTTTIAVKGADISHVMIGTIRYAKIPPAKSALFQVQVQIRGSFGKTYHIVFSRINYKRSVHDQRYRQYTQQLESRRVTFS